MTAHKPMGVNFIGDLSGALGLSEAARLVMQAIRANHIPVSYIPLQYQENRSVEFDKDLEAIQNGVQYPFNLLFYNLNALHTISGGDLSKMTGDGYTAAYWYWELMQVPEEWRQHFYRVNEIWVASRFVQEAMLKAGHRSVHVIPQPVSVHTSDAIDRGQFNLPKNRYIFLFSFSASSGFGRKNPWGVIDAYEQAFGKSRASDKPLLVIKVHHPQKFPELHQKLRKRVEQVGGVLLEKSYTRQQVNDLMACIDCYVSLHRAEGFGLGMAESMYLGKPVIGTAYSSNIDFMRTHNSFLVDYTLREIQVKDHEGQEEFGYIYAPGAVWAEPDVDHAASHMVYLFENPEKGKAVGARAAAFIRQNYNVQVTGERLLQRLNDIAQKTDVELYRKRNRGWNLWRYFHASQQHFENQSKRLRISFWTPLPPEKTGIADYSVELIRALTRFVDIEVFLDDGAAPARELKKEFQLYRASEYAERDRQHPFDLDIYQFGNSPFHLYIIEQSHKKPGISVLHDFTMGHLFYYNLVRTQGENAIKYLKDEFLYSEGEVGLRALNYYLSSNDMTTKQALTNAFTEFYLLRRYVANSLAQVVHMETARDILSERYNCNDAYNLYQGCVDPYDQVNYMSHQMLRDELKLKNDQFVVGIFGGIQETKQVHVALRAIRQLVDEGVNVLLVMVGERVSHDADYISDIDDLVKDLELANHVRFTGYVSKDDLLKYMIACDVQVNLRYPSNMQMSATLIRAIAAGTPLVISDLPEWQFFPDMFCKRVPTSDQEGRHLANHLREFYENRDLLSQAGEVAREYYLQNGTLSIWAANMMNIIYDVHQKRIVQKQADAIQPVQQYVYKFDDTAPGSGWRHKEVTPKGENFQWSVAKEATLNALLDNQFDYDIQFSILRHNSASKSLQLLVNDTMVHTEHDETADTYEFSASVPKTLLANQLDNTEFTFRVPTLLQTDSGSRLGIPMTSFKAVAADNSSTKEGEQPAMITGEYMGWGDIETTADHQTYRWTISPTATIHIPGPFLPSDYQLQFKVYYAITPTMQQELQVFANQTYRLTLQPEENTGNNVWIGRVPREVIAASGKHLELQFRTPGVVSAAEVGTGEDTRQLGIAIGGIQLYPQKTFNTADALQAWNRIRLTDVLSASAKILNRIPIIGFLYRTLVRIRNLGNIYEAQWQIYKEMQRQSDWLTQSTLRIDEQMRHMQLAVDTLRQQEEPDFLAAQATQLEEALTRYETKFAEITNQINTNTDLFNELDAKTSHLKELIGEQQVVERQITLLKARFDEFNARVEQNHQLAVSVEQQVHGLSDRIFTPLPELPTFVALAETDPGFAEAISTDSLRIVDNFVDNMSYFDTESEKTSDLMYVAHQQVFRGSESLIKERQKHYLPYLPLKSIPPDTSVIDIGCGRGEFMELLRDEDVPVIGIDNNKVHIQRLNKLGYNAHYSEGIDFLKSVDDSSVAGISAFQVIEHLTADELMKFIEVVAQKLADDGFVLLETLNPYNVTAMRNFHYDLTHIHPIPPMLLVTYLKFFGFSDYHLFLSSPVGGIQIDRVSSFERYQDYAVLARITKTGTHSGR